MPSRIIPLVNDHFYHIYNRGSEKRPIFENQRDYQRFLKTLIYYQIEGPKPRFSKFPSLTVTKLDGNKKLVEILAYCLMPNHFHLLLKQIRDKGITEFLSHLSNSYTKYYNTKYNRVGHLFQSEFKAAIMESDEQLLHVSRYIHLNPIVSGLITNLEQYKWSSYPEYATGVNGLCSKEEIQTNFKNPQDYQQFVLDQVAYAQELESIKHQLIDEI